MPTNGSVSISKGYYNNGTYEIITQGVTASLADLKQNQTVGCKNDLYMTTASGTAVPYITSLAAPTGTFDATVKLNTPVYLNWAKEYIAGGAEIAPEWSFSNDTYFPNYTVAGSPTISSDYIASGFSITNYVEMTSTSTYSSYELTLLAKLTTTTDQQVLVSNSRSSSYSLMRYHNGYWGVWGPSQGWSSTGNAPATIGNTYWLRVVYTGTSLNLYVSNYVEGLGPSQDQSDWVLASTITNASDVTGYGEFFSYNTRIGFNSGYGEQFRGEIDLKNTYLKVNGTEVWRAVEHTETAVSTTKALSYDSVSDKTYWCPQETTVTLADVKDVQTVGMKNDLYFTNTTGSPTASITFCEGTPLGVTEYYQQPEHVWLNSSKDTILGVQEEPDEIVLELEETSTVSASQDHYWTYLKDSTYDCKGKSISISSMTGSALSGYLLATPAGTLVYTGSNNQGVFGDAFLGYTITFTDTSHSAIASLTKTGTRYRIYRSAGINPEVPIEFVAMSYEDYGSFAGGALPSASKSYGLTADSPIEYTSTTTFTLSTDEIQGFDYYNPTEDKFYVYEIGLWTGYQALSYIGDMYIIDSTGA